jgi:hypothetical protein
MRASESSKGRFGKENRSIQSVIAIISMRGDETARTWASGKQASGRSAD